MFDVVWYKQYEHDGWLYKRPERELLGHSKFWGCVWISWCVLIEKACELWLVGLSWLSYLLISLILSDCIYRTCTWATLTLNCWLVWDKRVLSYRKFKVFLCGNIICFNKLLLYRRMGGANNKDINIKWFLISKIKLIKVTVPSNSFWKLLNNFFKISH